MGDIKAVTLDVGGTLAIGGLDKRMYASRTIDYLRRSGFDRTVAEYQRAVDAALKELSKVRQKQAEMRFEDFCSIVLRELKINPDKELLDNIRSIYYECFKQTVKRGSRSLILDLSKKYDLALISNSMSLLPKRFLEENGLAPYFKVFAISGEVGFRKPHPKIFEFALKELGVDPKQAAHIGNLIEEDVIGAKGVGMYSIFLGDRGLDEAETVPDLVVGSVSEIPSAIEILDSPRLREIKELMGDRCWMCPSLGVNLFKVDSKGGEEMDNFVALCPRCRKEIARRPRRVMQKKPSKRGKYRAVYRRAWVKSHSLSQILLKLN